MHVVTGDDKGSELMFSTVRQHCRQCCCGSAAAGRREAETLRERQAAAYLSYPLRLFDEACTQDPRCYSTRGAENAGLIDKLHGALASLRNAKLSPTQGVAESEALHG